MLETGRSDFFSSLCGYEKQGQTDNRLTTDYKCHVFILLPVYMNITFSNYQSIIIVATCKTGPT